MSAPQGEKKNEGYDPRVALDFFKAAGKPEKIAAGETIFEEKEKASALLRRPTMIYLLLQGEVELLAGKKVIGSVRAGEIFGELAAITQAPRSAAAVAKSACRLIALDDKALQAGLRKKPAFALMLMSVMIRRLRETISALNAAGELTADKAAKEGAVFNPKHLAELVKGFSDEQPVHYDRRKTIVQAGQSGVRMYVITEGKANVMIGERVVERLGPGGVFGEIALVDPSPRVASVVAETDCTLLPITRTAFLALIKMSPGFAESMLGALADRLRFLAARVPKEA